MKTSVGKSSWICRFLAVLMLVSVLCGQGNAGVRAMEKTTKASVSLGSAGSSGADWANESLFTGNVTLSIPLATVGGVKLNLSYNSRVSSLVRSSNSITGSGWVGLGWTLPVGSIVGTISGTRDTCDDRYQLVDAGGSADLVQASDGTFLLGEHRPWLIRRILTSGTIVGWEVKTEDGTVLRYGNYDKTTKTWIFPAYGPTYATRCATGINGVIENSRPQDYARDSLIPNQWDLSDIQDPGGKHTTIIYQQSQACLKVGTDSTAVRYTVESHPYKIQDDTGGEIELVLGTMNADEYYMETNTWNQFPYEKQFLDTLKIKRNGSVYQRLNLKYRWSQDILSKGAKKRYLSAIDIYDRNGTLMPYGMFDYWGLVDTTKGVNPGALRRITYQTGGKQEFTYKSQRASSVLTSYTAIVSDSIKASLATLPNASGVSGKDFFVVSNALYAQAGCYDNWALGVTSLPIQPIRVYRFGPHGWHRDTSFPYDSSGNAFIVNDCVVGVFRGVWKAVRRVGASWAIFDIDTALAAVGADVYGKLANTKGVVGFTPEYFVMKYNRTSSTVGLIHRYLSSLAVVRLGDDGLHAELLDGRFREMRGEFDDASGFRGFNIAAEGSSTYLIVSSIDSIPGIDGHALETHYKRMNGQWTKVRDTLAVSNPWQNAPNRGPVFPTSLPRYAIGKNFVVCTYMEPQYSDMTVRVYQLTRTGIVQVDTAHTDWYAQPVVGDTYYGVMNTSWPSTPWYKSWVGDSFGPKKYLSSIFSGLGASQCGWFRSGNRLICTWPSLQDTLVRTAVSICDGTGAWSPAIVKEAPFKLTGPPMFRILPVSGNSFLNVYDGSTLPDRYNPTGHKFVKLSSYSFNGDSLDVRLLAKSWTEDDSGNAISAPINDFTCSHTYQPGNNFFTFSSTNTPDLGPADTLFVTSRAQDSLGHDSYGGVPFDIVLDKKLVISGMGDTVVTQYAFENGAFEESMSSGKYNKATVTLPGSSGKTTRFYYNGLDGSQANEFVTASNFAALDGRAYRQKDSSATGALVRERVSQYAADVIDLPNRGVFFTKQLKDSVVTDSVSSVTSYDYENPLHLQVTTITETNSPPLKRVTHMKYPLDYDSTASNPTDAMMCALDSMKTVLHMVNPVIEKWIVQDSGGVKTVMSGEIVKFKSYGPAQLLPEQELKLRASAPVPEATFTASRSGSAGFNCDSRYLRQRTVDLYTPYGQVIQETDANGSKRATKWGYNSTVPTAVIANGSNSETSICDLEDGTLGEWSPSGIPGEISTTAHTGTKSWHAGSTGKAGVQRVMQVSNLTLGRTYAISGWVKSTSAKALICYMGTYNGTSSTWSSPLYYGRGTGSWERLECSVTLDPGVFPNATSVAIYALNGPYGQPSYTECWWDDLRFAPQDAAVKTTTYDPLLLLPTSESDGAGAFTATTYDGFGRPTQVANPQGALLKSYSYYFSRDGNDSTFSPADPNYTRETTFRAGADTTLLKTYTDGLGREIQKQVSYGDSDLVSQTKYDSLGRPRYTYKPYQWGLGDSMHRYDPSYATHLSSYYSGLGITLGATPYSETRYCPDPLNRVQFQGAPGDSFAVGSGHEIRQSYASDGSAKYLTTRRDEQGDTTRISKDLFGNVVKSEVLMGSAASLVTTSTYDALGNLTQSQPPLGPDLRTFYFYTTRNELYWKTTPDAGSVFHLYDKQGNVRFVADWAHQGSGANNVTIPGSINPGAQASGNFTLNDRGPVSLMLNAPGFPVSGGNVTMTVKTVGGTALASLVTTGTMQSTSLVLPQGTYSYSVVSTATSQLPIPYLLQCTDEYPFTFTKYDGQGRILMQGEYQATNASNFTQTLADSVAFPGSSYLLAKWFAYDAKSNDPMAANQHNLQGRLSWASSYRLGTLALTTFYSYDEMGRVEWIVQKGLGSSYKKLSYSYDLQGNVLQKSYTDGYNPSNNHTWWYEYDAAGRLARVWSGMDLNTRLKEAEYSYLATGKENQLALGMAPAQMVNYAYNQRDWATSIASTKFWETLGYESIQRVGSAVNAPAQYGGNISYMAYAEPGNHFTWGATTTDSIGYGFFYDKSNRLTAGKFGYRTETSWGSCNSFNMPYIGYDANGNIDSLVRYDTYAQQKDNLKYHYLANSNRLEYITDHATAPDTSGIHDQGHGAYRYDGNGNVQADTSRNMALIVYDMNNLPVAEYKRDGTLVQYVYDASGVRVQKTVGAGAPTWYVEGADGKAEVVYAGSTSNPSYNIWAGASLVGQVKRSGGMLTRYLHLKDHLGSVRVTVSPVAVQDDFAGDLAQWTTVLGNGFAVTSGYLYNNSPNQDNVLVDATGPSIGNGTISCDVMAVSSNPDLSLVVRYQDPNNYYLIHTFYGNQIVIYKKVNGTYTAASQVTIPATLYPGMWYNVKVVLNGSIITVYWGGGLALSWSDPSPWLSGKVGFRQCAGRQVRWDNFLAWDAGASPTVAAYDDYYPFGQQMDNRSFNNGFADGRYKYTEKERDAETGYDYFGARYYDARVGRWLSSDPLKEKYRNMSPYAYAGNNSVSIVDLDGRGLTSAQEKQLRANTPEATWQGLTKAVTSGTAPGLSGMVKYVGNVLGAATRFVGAVLAPPGSELLPTGMVLRGAEAAAKLPGAMEGMAKSVTVERSISMDQAVTRGAEHVGGNGVMEMTGMTTTGERNFQFRNTVTDATGETTTTISRFDVNPSNQHVQEVGPHLNMEVQVNGVQTQNAHLPIDPTTVRTGDFPQVQ